MGIVAECKIADCSKAARQMGLLVHSWPGDAQGNVLSAPAPEGAA